MSVEMVVHVAAGAQRGTLDRRSEKGTLGKGNGKGSDGARVGDSDSSFVVATERSQREVELSSKTNTSISTHSCHGILVEDKDHDFFNGAPDKESPANTSKAHGTRRAPAATVVLLFEEDTSSDISRENETNLNDGDDGETNALVEEVLGDPRLLGTEGQLENVVGWRGERQRETEGKIRFQIRR